jgi:hypothetical protein
MNTELTRDQVAHMSGDRYVYGRLREEGSDAEPARIPIRERCEHVATICPSCAETWALDWVLLFDRTAGGRNLRDRASS